MRTSLWNRSLEFSLVVTVVSTAGELLAGEHWFLLDCSTHESQPTYSSFPSQRDSSPSCFVSLHMTIQAGRASLLEVPLIKGFFWPKHFFLFSSYLQRWVIGSSTISYTTRFPVYVPPPTGIIFAVHRLAAQQASPFHQRLCYCSRVLEKTFPVSL